jgi:hypothetical protein
MIYLLTDLRYDGALQQRAQRPSSVLLGWPTWGLARCSDVPLQHYYQTPLAASNSILCSPHPPSPSWRGACRRCRYPLLGPIWFIVPGLKKGKKGREGGRIRNTIGIKITASDPCPRRGPKSHLDRLRRNGVLDGSPKSLQYSFPDRWELELTRRRLAVAKSDTGTSVTSRTERPAPVSIYRP